MRDLLQSINIVNEWRQAVFDDPLTPMRRRFPTGPTWDLPAPPADAPEMPFAVRYGVPPDVVTYAKHERQPTKTKVSNPTQLSGDGKAQPPRPDDTLIDAFD